ncbi:MAG: 16S rRNA (guanine(966)-N(2))-methyltransferase RsmD [Ruminococcaceae bacterium]|nr:16S rRNA (guanine(966)-N(2))-methyltransferase RsmD [Oscillospiraceae bacterium]
MRVITGTARGRKLRTLAGDEVRPTSDNVKEAMFSIIQFDIEGRAVLDLFSGSGQLGIEALSRGARICTFVDSSRHSLEVTRENVATCRFDDRANIVLSDAATFLQRAQSKGQRFDIALLDPPYESNLLDKLLPEMAQVMNTGGVILCEAPERKVLPETAGEFVKRRTYRHGRIALTLYRHSSID